LSFIRVPLWLGVDLYYPSRFREKIVLSFDPGFEDLLPLIQLASPRHVVVSGRAWGDHLWIKVNFFYASLSEAEEAVERLREAGVLETTKSNIRKKFQKHIVKLIKTRRLYPEELVELNLSPEDKAKIIARILLEET